MKLSNCSEVSRFNGCVQIDEGGSRVLLNYKEAKLLLRFLDKLFIEKRGRTE